MKSVCAFIITETENVVDAMENKFEFDLDEMEYTEEEAAEVSIQLRFALMFGELKTITTKNHLKDWFAKMQMCKSLKGVDWCENITTIDLLEIAEREGIRII